MTVILHHSINTDLLDIVDINILLLQGDLGKNQGKVSAKDCVMKIGSVHVKFKGGAR